MMEIMSKYIGEDESVEVQRLFQKLSVALMRGNCALMNRVVGASKF